MFSWCRIGVRQLGLQLNANSNNDTKLEHKVKLTRENLRGGGIDAKISRRRREVLFTSVCTLLRGFDVDPFSVR